MSSRACLSGSVALRAFIPFFALYTFPHIRKLQHQACFYQQYDSRAQREHRARRSLPSKQASSDGGSILDNCMNRMVQDRGGN